MTEAAERAGISRAAARRLLLTLVHLGYAQEGVRGYAFTARAMRLGYAYLSGLSGLSGLSLAEVVEPFVKRLSEQSGEWLEHGGASGSRATALAAGPCGQE